MAGNLPHLTDEPVYKNIQQYYNCNGTNINIKKLFAEDAERFNKYSLTVKTPKDGDILFDYSKNRITPEVWSMLLELAKVRRVQEARDAMMSGQPINITENRAVLHVALRNRSNDAITVNGKDVMPEVRTELAHMKEFSEKIITGAWTGCTGKPIKNVVNIGIGGSDLGPLMVTEALKPYKTHLTSYFVSNIDGTHMAEVLKKVNYEETLFIIASKTFTTQETITNATSAKDSNCFRIQ